MSDENSDPVEPWRVHTSKRLLERKWLVLHEQHLLLPRGVEIEEYHLIESPHWVAVVAIDEANQIVMVDQYRHGLGGVSRELPAGMIDEAETPLEAARRELLEETGYASDDWMPLQTVAPEPARGTSRAWFFVARAARRIGPARPEASENIQLKLLSAAALLDAIDGGHIAHGVHVGAILLAHRRGYLGPADG